MSEFILHRLTKFQQNQAMHNWVIAIRQVLSARFSAAIL